MIMCVCEQISVHVFVCEGQHTHLCVNVCVCVIMFVCVEHNRPPGNRSKFPADLQV